LQLPCIVPLIFLAHGHHRSLLSFYTTLFRSQLQQQVELVLYALPLLRAHPDPDGLGLATVIRLLRPLRLRAHGRDDVTGVGENRSEEHTSELQSRENLVCRLLLEKKNKKNTH